MDLGISMITLMKSVVSILLIGLLWGCAALESLLGWEHVDGALSKSFAFKDFPGAITFIVALSYVCEELDHHPDIYNVYRKVVISTTTHDAMNKVTETDVELATRIESISKQFL